MRLFCNDQEIWLIEGSGQCAEVVNWECFYFTTLGIGSLSCVL